MENHEDPDEPQEQQQLPPLPPVGAAAAFALGAPQVGYHPHPALPAPFNHYGHGLPGAGSPTPSPITINLIGTMSRAQQSMVSGLLQNHGSPLDVADAGPALGPVRGNLNGTLQWEEERRRGPGRPPLNRRGGRGRGNVARMQPYAFPPFGFEVGPLPPQGAAPSAPAALPAPPSAPAAAAPPVLVSSATQTPAPRLECTVCREDINLGLLNLCGHVLCEECKSLVLRGPTAQCPSNNCIIFFSASNFIRIRR